MVAELGNFALILALCLALFQSVLPLVGAKTGSLRLMRTGRFLASGLTRIFREIAGCTPQQFRKQNHKS
ncbi:hypothetical protein [Halomonas campaniensis]|uniref:hypothetical protein n=1 Tax=Halomonas campaniensis TaxID=213554 RepID=UPI003970CB26